MGSKVLTAVIALLTVVPVTLPAAAAQYADLVPGTTSANRQILAIGNSDTYGGAGGTYATASGGNALSALIAPHGLGRSLGGLQDEYDYYAWRPDRLVANPAPARP